jgi:hypothetical protein
MHGRMVLAGDFRKWHIAEQPSRSNNVRFCGLTGRTQRGVGKAANDPKADLVLQTPRNGRRASQITPRMRRCIVWPRGEELARPILLWSYVLPCHGERKRVPSSDHVILSAHASKNRRRKPLRHDLVNDLPVVSREQNDPIGGAVRSANLLLGCEGARLWGARQKQMGTSQSRLR